MREEDTKSIRMGMESVKILRNLKARLTIEFDVDVTYQDALNFAMCQRVLDSETIISFIRAFLLAEDIKRLRFEGREKRGFGDAIYKLVRTLRSSKAERREVLHLIADELGEDTEEKFPEEKMEIEDTRKKFADSREKIMEVPENSLTQVQLEKAEEREINTSKRGGEGQNESG